MYNIEKLNETDYDSWSLHIKAVLIISISAISDDIPTAAWAKRGEKATSKVILSVTPTQISYIRNCQSASAA